MPARQRRQLRALLSLALLLIATLHALPVDNGAASPATTEASTTLLDEPEFSIRFGRNRLLLAGSTVSTEHEAALLQLAAEHFAASVIDTDFRKAVILSPDWETLSARLLYLVAATESAQARLDAKAIEVRGVIHKVSDFERRSDFLREAAGAHRSMRSDVIAIDDSNPFDELCQRNFASFAFEPIQFRQSGTGIRESSYPLLDKLAEFTFDCDHSRIAIVGHSDATGAADWNLQISRVRAESVAAELQRRGVAPERLIIEARGASQPIASNDTVAGRERNRRAVFELR